MKQADASFNISPERVHLSLLSDFCVHHSMLICSLDQVLQDSESRFAMNNATEDPLRSRKASYR